MAKISIKKRLEIEIKRIEDRLSSLNNSLKSIKNNKKEVESKYVDDIIASASLSTFISKPSFTHQSNILVIYHINSYNTISFTHILEFFFIVIVKAIN